MPHRPPPAPVRPTPWADVCPSIRGVLEVLLESPESPLYTPVFVGPLASAAPLYEELQGLAGSRGFRLAVGGDAPRERGTTWLADVETAERALAGGANPGAGVQWVVWGASDAGALPDRLAAWVAGAGIPVRPCAGSGGPGAELAAAVEIALRDAGEARRRHFVVVVGAAGDLDVLAAELHFQLETVAAGVPRVWRGPAAAWRSGVEGGRGARVLVCGAGERGGEELAARLQREPGGGVWGVVVEDGRFAGWSAGGAWARLLERARVVRRTPRPPLPLPERALPGLDELLPGAPRAARVVEDPVLFHLRLVPLAEVLQSAVGWSAPGTLVVFGPGRFGWVEVAHGRIRGAGERGHTPASAPGGPEEEVYRVLGRMAAWEDASAAFVPAERPAGGPARSEGVPVAHALFAVAKAADEAVPVPGGGGAGGGLRAYQVAEALLERGLPTLAGAFLERMERASAWGAEEDLLLGHLSAERHPQAAAARLRHGALRAVSAGAEDPARLAVYVRATLGALLLEVRAGSTVPAAALAVIRGWLDDAGTGWVEDARHAAIWLEIALRAGAGASAWEAQRTLEALAGAERSRWAPLLDLSLPADGGVIGGEPG